MSQATPTRRALVDLPVNTLGTPSAVGDDRKSSTTYKRPIEAVAEPEYPLAISRVKASATRPQNNLRDGMLLPDVGLESAATFGLEAHNVVRHRPLYRLESVYPLDQ